MRYWSGYTHLGIAATTAYALDSLYPWMGVALFCVYPVALMAYRGMSR